MSFGDDTLDPLNVNKHHLDNAVMLLKDYLGEFPEHDQGDFRIWKALQFLEEIKGI